MQTSAALNEFECPECGEPGVVMYDGDPREDGPAARDPLYFRSVPK